MCGSRKRRSRKDSNPALFVTIRNPHHRLKAGGLHYAMVKQSNVKMAHKKYIG